MILFPAKTKYKKYKKSKDRFLGYDNKYFLPNVGVYGLKILQSRRITVRQLEAARKVIRKKLKGKVKEHVMLTIFPDLPLTKKSSGVRMGKGKGNIEAWCFPLNIGRILFELSFAISKYNAKRAFQKGAKKVGLKNRIIYFS